MNKPGQDALAKVEDPALRKKVAAGGNEPVSVILEVDLPPQQVDVASRQDRLRGTTSLARSVIAESKAQQHENARRIERTRDYLESVLGAPPRWLAAARAFTFSGTPEQLRAIAAFEYTRAVRPNRRLAP